MSFFAVENRKIDRYYSWFQNILLCWMLYSLFSVIPRSLKFMSRRFETICSMDGTESSETSAYEFRIMGDHPKGRMQTSITYSECVFVALFIQHAMLMLQTAICGLPVLRKNFPLFHTRHDFRKINLSNVKYIFIFSPAVVWSISRSRNSWARYDLKRISVGLHFKFRLFLSDFNATWLF